MKATGIVRRVDDLGRVVIPKELRRTHGIREGDLIEYQGKKVSKATITELAKLAGLI